MTPSDIEKIKELLPTTLGSAEIREQIAADILRRSVFSARMASARYLATIRDVCTDVSAGTINQAEARTRLLTVLQQLGYDPTTGNPTDLADPVSERRLNLIVDTQRQMASSVARLMQQDEGTLEQFPGWELCRIGSREMPRQDWLSRWQQAGQSVGWEGAVKHPIYGDVNAYGFLALKSSPIWQALGDGAGGFTDTLGNPYPPFCYSSGMAWLDADRETCERYGLELESKVGVGEKGESDLQLQLETPTLSPAEQDILDACDQYGIDLSEGLL